MLPASFWCLETVSKQPHPLCSTMPGAVGAVCSPSLEGQPPAPGLPHGAVRGWAARSAGLPCRGGDGGGVRAAAQYSGGSSLGAICGRGDVSGDHPRAYGCSARPPASVLPVHPIQHLHLGVGCESRLFPDVNKCACRRAPLAEPSLEMRLLPAHARKAASSFRRIS